MTSTDLRVSVLLSAQRALLGSIGTAVRKIMCHWTEHEIQVRVVFGSEIAEEDAEAMSDAETEMMADFPRHKVSFKLERCDSPKKIKQCTDEQCKRYPRP
jgi:hypothetical protein